MTRWKSSNGYRGLSMVSVAQRLASLTMPLSLSVVTDWRSITHSRAGLPPVPPAYAGGFKRDAVRRGRPDSSSCSAGLRRIPTHKLDRKIPLYYEHNRQRRCAPMRGNLKPESVATFTEIRTNYTEFYEDLSGCANDLVKKAYD